MPAMQVTAPISTVNSSFLAQSKSFDVENGTHFYCEKLFLIQSKSYEGENSTPLMGPEPTKIWLHTECFTYV